MPYTLCVYYSRTGATEKLMREIAQELKCEIVKLDDGVNRAGVRGWLDRKSTRLNSSHIH